jgi:RNA polymerase sigma-70 factor (ECF subfamily)
MSDATARDMLLMGRIAARDREAFRDFFDAHGSTALGVLVRMLRDRAEAEEALQEAFLQVWQQADRYRPERASPRGWLLMIARSRALDRLRSHRARRRREEDAGGAASAVAEPEALRALESAERESRVEAALAGLPPEQRRCVEMAFFGGLTHREIAEDLDQPLGTVKSRILMGMNKLREALATGRASGRPTTR